MIRHHVGYTVFLIQVSKTATHKIWFAYLQHLAENLDMELSALEFMMKEFPEVKERDEMRKIVGRYGLTGQQQVKITISPQLILITNL